MKDPHEVRKAAIETDMIDAAERRAMNEQQALQRIEPAPIQRVAPSPADMLQAIIEKGVTSENVGALEKIVGLYERMQDRSAEQDFARAFVALQAETSVIHATKAIPMKAGGVKYSYAEYQEIMAQLTPLLKKHGFTLTFSQRSDGQRITILGTVQHINGHSQQSEFTVRIGRGPLDTDQWQADGAASTGAKRYLVISIFNLVTSGQMDEDARAEGATVTAEQAKSLRDRVNNTQTDSSRFLKLAGGVTEFEKIPAVMFTILDDFLAKRERLKQKGTTP